MLDVPEDLRDTFRYRPGQFCSFRIHVDGDEVDRATDQGIYERYDTYELYAAYPDKARFFANADANSVWVVNGDDRAAIDLAREAVGTHKHFSLKKADADATYDRAHDMLVVGGALGWLRGGASVLLFLALALVGTPNVSATGVTGARAVCASMRTSVSSSLSVTTLPASSPSASVWPTSSVTPQNP